MRAAVEDTLQIFGRSAGAHIGGNHRGVVRRLENGVRFLDFDVVCERDGEVVIFPPEPVH